MADQFLAEGPEIPNGPAEIVDLWVVYRYIEPYCDEGPIKYVPVSVHRQRPTHDQLLVDGQLGLDHYVKCVVSGNQVAILDVEYNCLTLEDA